MNRVLHVTEELSAAGIESFFMNLYRNIDREKVQFDFLVMRNRKEFYDEEIQKLGGKKYCISAKGRNLIQKIDAESKQMEAFLKEHPYDVVHIHATTPMRCKYLKAAKAAGVPTRIYHSHSGFVSGKSKLKMMIYKMRQKEITKYASDFFACSVVAAGWMYEKSLISGNRVRIVHNGIDTKAYCFDEAVRFRMREKLGINEEKVLIHVGRFTEQKNQLFLLEIFQKLHSTDDNTKLILLGDGPMKDEILAKIREYHLEESVLVPGVTNRVQDYLFAADCFVMPSLYEGLPVTAVEAQCAGLPCVLSEEITKETAFSDQTQFVKLEQNAGTGQNADDWVSVIQAVLKDAGKTGDKTGSGAESSSGVESKSTDVTMNSDRAQGARLTKAAGYDMQDVAKKLEEFYLSRFKN